MRARHWGKPLFGRRRRSVAAANLRSEFTIEAKPLRKGKAVYALEFTATRKREFQLQLDLATGDKLPKLLERALQAKRVGMEREQPTIAAIVTGRDPDEAALIENVQRQDLHAVELARAVSRLAERHGYKQEELAAAIGKSQGEISKLMRILALPASILDEAGSMPGMTRAALYRLTMVEADERDALWREMKGGTPEPGGAVPVRRKAPTSRGDAVSRAISSFGAKVEKLTPQDLSDEQRRKLQGLRDAIDALLNIPEE